jgi:hypothetical protein
VGSLSFGALALVSDTAEAQMPPEKSTCGIVMPISATDGCSEDHWKDVLAILSDAVRLSGYEPNLVSNDNDIGVIQKRIVQNLYNNPVVICDVSGRNPNVMFELGMRLAFDKPVVIVKDDKTPYSFDTSPVEHLSYPRDLRFGAIVEFKRRLSEKISASFTSRNSFLSSFGKFKVAKIEEESAGALDIILEEIGALKSSVRRLEDRGIARNQRTVIEKDDLVKMLSTPRGLSHGISGGVNLNVVVNGSEEKRAMFSGSLKADPKILDVQRFAEANDHERFVVSARNEVHPSEVISTIWAIAKRCGVSIDQPTFEEGVFG